MCFVWCPAAKAFLAEAVAYGIILDLKSQLHSHQLRGAENWLQNEKKTVLALEELPKLCSHLPIVPWVLLQMGTGQMTPESAVESLPD